MKEFTYFPGCSLECSTKSYDLSAKTVSNKLGIKLTELEDWNCCGATAYMSVRELKAFVLSARNIALAEKKQMDIVTLCSACFTILSKTVKYLNSNLTLKAEVNEALETIGLKCECTIKIRHLLDIIVNDVKEDAVRECVTNPICGLKVAAYYGCQIVRPGGEFDDPEGPVSLDNLIEWLGGESVYFPMKVKYCGGLMMMTEEETGLELTKSVLDAAIENGADCIVTTCPLCQINLETCQAQINKKYKVKISIPVMFFTQLAGVAFGFREKELMLGKELVPVKSVLSEYIYA